MNRANWRIAGAVLSTLHELLIHRLDDIGDMDDTDGWPGDPHE
ncbi:hypothetical protein N5O73_20715 [Escherichia coli]|nr:hypothetical protein [Escherichia coli]UXE75909.1 hypothetical protein N5O73_20715 [Escherichia coli]